MALVEGERVAHLGQTIIEATKQYIEDVHSGEYPSQDESFSMDDSVLRELSDSSDNGEKEDR